MPQLHLADADNVHGAEYSLKHQAHEQEAQAVHQARNQVY